jgi:hypothetical protein
MAGFIPTEGKTLVSRVVHGRTHADRDANLELGLFTNVSVGASTTLAQITEPTGGGYARKTLSDGSWSISGGVSEYAEQTFEPVGTDYSAAVYGYFICTKSAGGTQRVVYIEADGSGPYTLRVDDSYKITPRITVV